MTEETASGSITNAQFEQLMSKLCQTRSELLTKINQLQQNQDDAAHRVVKKLKAGTFQKKGTKLQFRFNAKVENNLQWASTEALKINPTSDNKRKALETLKAELQGGMKAIATHQKMIRVADCSDYGWAVVEEYGCDPLASDGEDEKSLIKAEKNAERKVMKRNTNNHW